MQLGIAMVLLEHDAPVDLRALRDSLARNWPDLPPATNFKQADNTISFDLGANNVILGKMPAPIPWSDLEGPCATSILWPTATQDVPRHRLHWIVTAMGDLNPLPLSTLLTQATAALVEACPAAMGVYWGNATLLVPKQIFCEFAREILPHGPPVFIWVDFRVGRDSPQTTAGFTTGMAALGHMEFETRNCPEAPGDLRERLVALVNYVLEHGPVIRDGDTVGEDEHERIRVDFKPSSFGQERTVMRLDYQRSSPKKPWWQFW